MTTKVEFQYIKKKSLKLLKGFHILSVSTWYRLTVTDTVHKNSTVAYLCETKDGQRILYFVLK